MLRFFYFIFLPVFLACNGTKDVKKTVAQAVLPVDKNVLILDSLAASQAIVQDEVEHFFKNITAADMAIQLQDNSFKDQREKLLEIYKKDLQGDVRDFTKTEKSYVISVMEEAIKIVDAHAAGFKYDEIKLIKVTGKHYGDFTFYTRENCIVIPAPAFKMPRENFTQTMFHELFHIYSRYDEETRNKLYALIGFTPVGNPSNLLMKDALRKKVLLNPDGVNFAYAIQLQDQNKELFQAIPIITTNTDGYDPEKKSFFDYLDFNLYRLNAGHTLRVLTDDAGNSTLNLQSQPDFFTTIGDNTQYIIHPDEILADNYAFIMMGKKDPAFLNRFSVNGKALMKKVEELVD